MKKILLVVILTLFRSNSTVMSCSTNNSSDIVGSEKYVFDQFMLYINLEYESDEIYKKHFDKLFKHHFDKIIIDSNFIENFNTFIYNCKYVSRKKYE